LQQKYVVHNLGGIQPEMRFLAPDSAWGLVSSRKNVRIDIMLAYLVIREGNKWSDVFRLTPGGR
jgi:hypothetical protein